MKCRSLTCRYRKGLLKQHSAMLLKCKSLPKLEPIENNLDDQTQDEQTKYERYRRH